MSRTNGTNMLVGNGILPTYTTDADEDAFFVGGGTPNFENNGGCPPPPMIGGGRRNKSLLQRMRPSAGGGVSFGTRTVSLWGGGNGL